MIKYNSHSWAVRIDVSSQAPDVFRRSTAKTPSRSKAITMHAVAILLLLSLTQPEQGIYVTVPTLRLHTWKPCHV